MLIIFDLDDTLVDTTNSITPACLEMALDSMIATGLGVSCRNSALTVLLDLNRQSESSRAALVQFLSAFPNGDRFLDLAVQQVYETTPPASSVLPVPGAVEALQTLSLRHTLTLVSVGFEDRQLFKMEKAGIDSTLFSKLIFLPGPDKKKSYQGILSSFRHLPSGTVVCGDRAATDLAPAKEMGCITVQMTRGRGERLKKEEADFAACDLWQVQEIIHKLETI